MREFKSKKAFADYLKSIWGEKPFDCEYLRVLPENFSFEIKHPPAISYYYKGELLCIRSAKVKQYALNDPHCEINGRLELNRGGELETTCKWSDFLNKTWKIKVIE